jgi:hypothetical protein
MGRHTKIQADHSGQSRPERENNEHIIPSKMSNDLDSTVETEENGEPGESFEDDGNGPAGGHSIDRGQLIFGQLDPERGRDFADESRDGRRHGGEWVRCQRGRRIREGDCLAPETKDVQRLFVGMVDECDGRGKQFGNDSIARRRGRSKSGQQPTEREVQVHV